MSDLLPQDGGDQGPVVLLNRRAKAAANGLNPSSAAGAIETDAPRHGKRSKKLRARSAENRVAVVDGDAEAHHHDDVDESAGLLRNGNDAAAVSGPNEPSPVFSTIAYDPTNPEAMATALKRLEHGTDERLFIPDSASMCIPAWLNRWAQLRFYADRASEGTIFDLLQAHEFEQRRFSTMTGAFPPSAPSFHPSNSSGSVETWSFTTAVISSCLERLKRDVTEAQSLHRDVMFGIDGGFFRKGARAIERQRLPAAPPSASMDQHQQQQQGSQEATSAVHTHDPIPLAVSNMEEKRALWFKAVDPFWMEAGSAAALTGELVTFLESCVAQLSELLAAREQRSALDADNAAKFTALPNGSLGVQEWPIPEAASKAQRATLERVAIEAVVDSNGSWLRRPVKAPAEIPTNSKSHRRHKDKSGTSASVAVAQRSSGIPDSQQQRAETIEETLSRLDMTTSAVVLCPTVHRDFILPDDTGDYRSVRMDPRLLRMPDMLEPPQSILSRTAAAASADENGRQKTHVYKVHLPFIRFRERADFSSEQVAASQLLDAYEQYQLLTGNLRQDLKSRGFYRQLLHALSATSTSSSAHPNLSLDGPGTNSTSQPPHSHHHARHVAALNELYHRSAEAECTCLTQMLFMWHQLEAIRAAQGFRSVQLNLVFRRHNVTDPHVPSETGAPHSDDGMAATNHANYRYLLNYSPVVTDDAPPLPPSMPTSDGSSAPQPAAPTTLPFSTPPSMIAQGNKRFRVVLHARTSRTLPPQFVGSTEARCMNSTGTVFFHESIELRTLSIPSELLLSIVCDNDKSEMSAGINASSAASAVNSGVNHTSPAAGASVAQHIRIPPAVQNSAVFLLPFQTALCFTNENGESRETCGLVSVATTWTTATGYSIEAVERMFLRGELDPMDPRNEGFVELLRTFYLETSRAAGGGNDGDESLRFPSNGTEGNGGAQRKIREEGGLYVPQPPALNVRHQLLQRRWAVASRERSAEDEVEVRLAEQCVPLEEHAAKRLLRDLTRNVELAARASGGASKEQQQTARSSKAPSTGGPIASQSGATAIVVGQMRSPEEAHRQWQQKILGIKLMHQTQHRAADHEKLEQYLILPPLPTFQGILQQLIDTLSPRSNLNPRRDKRKDVSEIDRNQLAEQRGSASILVHVMKASSLPQRADGTELEPVMEARFVASAVSGRTEAGSDPSWFESLKLRFEPPDFDGTTLSLIDDPIVVNLYDQIRIPLPPASVTLGAPAHTVHFRIERRLLGTVRIPFYTLYTTLKASVEGTFKIDMPRWIMGYVLPPQESPSTVQLYVALNPPLRRQKEKERTLLAHLSALPVSQELHRIHVSALQWREKVEYWMAQLVAENPFVANRQTEPFVPNVVGDPVLVCRYLLPGGGPPPPTVTAVPHAIRFVSLMKFEVDMVTWGDKDVWSTNAEFLQKRRGDYEELALLLVHFLRYLAPNEQTYLVLGKGTQYHQAAFVLHSVQGVWKLIDPRVGSVTDVHNPHAALTEVSLIVSHDQMWANIQLSGSPYRMVWDTRDVRYWLPLFTEPLPPAYAAALAEPIQREHLEFPPVTTGTTVALEDNLKKAVKRALKSWRNDCQPTYQERVGTILREVLEEIDRERRECANYRQAAVDVAHQQALREFEGEYIAVGNPVSGSYRRDDPDFTEILEDVRETAAHLVGTDSVRFGVATYAYAYTEDTIALWVYLVALIPRSR